ncbi:MULTISPECIES: NUDIX hydrolase [unclassified Rhodococcus (in: high G+C Gram-positive bacteria)]|nr:MULTISPECIES: CoA pyrophosphatase [unclassified Rhodococcus (in: high G+C Gram-positive bacteria)]MBF0661185.1 CoA pyrophosphatase [Rhodococcus sp. (in: high G+C Gram-positive bacteria)]NMD97767.1 CoA pyrophosphatase [Rhodococcus sp. BL-253-APC-6A1W]NME80920.1 CoA pyrophosphatase [Rhodococcus sp. 105337]
MTPYWLRKVTTLEPKDPHDDNPIINRRAPSGLPVRQAAVLVLFGGSPTPDPLARGGLPADADVLLTQRAATLRQHSGQVAFPGGAADPDDEGPEHTALREAQEETGLDPAGVRPLAVLPELFIPPSGFDVTPVIAYWERPSPVGVVNPAEASRVVRVSLHDLLDPRNRFQVRHALGYRGPAFRVEGMLVWGFTAGVLAGLFAVSGWEIEWDHHDIRDLDVVLAEMETEVVEP